jgi:chromosome segregation ATPase
MNELIGVSLFAAGGLTGWFLTFSLWRQECGDLRQVADKLADKCKALEEVNETLEHNVEVLRGDSVKLAQAAREAQDSAISYSMALHSANKELTTANRRVAALKVHNARYRERLQSVTK